jgi:hypothetical protein
MNLSKPFMSGLPCLVATIVTHAVDHALARSPLSTIGG